MNYFSKPYNFLTATGALIFVFSLLTTSKTFDIHLHDTYFVVGMRQWLTMLALVLVALWTIYKLLDNILTIRILTVAHVALSIITVLILLAPLFMVAFINPGTVSVPGTPESQKRLENYRLLNTIVAMDITAFVLAQFLLIGHIVAGALRRFRK